MDIRREEPGDINAIRILTKAAFAPVEFSSQTEAEIIDALRAANALSLSLVAVGDGMVAGHIAFSPVTISGHASGWLGLGPIAVHPDRQRQGVGAGLIRTGLEQIRSAGASGCVVLGDPAFYRRFGFCADDRLTYANVPAEYFQMLAFEDSVPVGAVAYHPGFDAR